MNTTLNRAGFRSISKNEESHLFKRNNIKRQTLLKKKAYIAAISISIILMLIIICSGIIIANAADSNEVKFTQYKYYTSISIQKGDTLWSIASKYVSDSNTINNYLDEIKEINNLQTDCINQGQSLIVYYYSTDYK